MGRWGGAAEERESVIFFIDFFVGGVGVGVDPTLEKEEGFQFQTSQGMNGKTGVPGEKL